MDLREVEALLTELETRTDRLRALYEQYFMGFERLEPTVARKDVERRLQQLLRVPFRNTALRFRFTMLQQRYNTYQTYWMRTCRRIEDGTYKRQISRMKAKEGDLLRNVEAARTDDNVVEIGELELEELDDDDNTATLPPPRPAPEEEEEEVWAKPPPGNTFDTRPTTPRMQAVRLEDIAAIAAAKRAAERPKAPALRPRTLTEEEVHSRPTTPRMRAVRAPEKK